ncbi:MAG: hypothetical protein H0T53_13990, partial [Herpetosiphonaceae bacterium]|nr:hypothetical protein [Herpetosiphonaceae bacterium]
ATLPPPTDQPAPPANLGSLLILSRPDGSNPDSQLTAIQFAASTSLTVPQIYDVVAAPDGGRWYALGSAGGQTSVIALDPLTAAPLWQTPISQTLRYANDNGPTALAVAPDGSALYVLSYDGVLSQWLQVVDPATGALAKTTIRVSGMDSCGGVRFATYPSSTIIYLKCSEHVTTVYPRSGKYDGVPFYEPNKNIFLLNTSSIYGVIDGPRLIVFDLIYNAYNSNPNSFRRLAGPDDQLLDIEPGLIQLSGDRQFLVVGAVTATTELRVYSTTTWQETARISYPRPIRSNTLAVSHDGSRVYAVTAQAGARFQPDPIMLEFSAIFPGDRNRLVLTAEGTLATVDTVQRPAPPPPADTLVEFDAVTGAVRAEQTRPNADITRIVAVP